MRRATTRILLLNIYLISIAAVTVMTAVLWLERHCSEERAVDQFFEALQQQTFKKAYGARRHEQHATASPA